MVSPEECRSLKFFTCGYGKREDTGDDMMIDDTKRVHWHIGLEVIT
jgi:hypothetical protein